MVLTQRDHRSQNAVIAYQWRRPYIVIVLALSVLTREFTVEPVTAGIAETKGQKNLPGGQLAFCLLCSSHSASKS